MIIQRLPRSPKFCIIVYTVYETAQSRVFPLVWHLTWIKDVLDWIKAELHIRSSGDVLLEDLTALLVRHTLQICS